MPIRTNQAALIRDYIPADKDSFRDLNTAWIEKYFKLEKKDLESLNDPEGQILNQGGHILVATFNGEIAGVCALIKMPDQTYELAKMAVKPELQGKSIGWLLGRAVLEKAKALGAQKVYLESNTRLRPAINLYHKLGFKEITGAPSPYERCDIQMEVRLD